MPLPANTAPSMPEKPSRTAPWVAQALVFVGILGWVARFEPIPVLAALWHRTCLLPAAGLRGPGIIDIAGGVGILVSINVVFLALSTLVPWQHRVQPARVR